jgi:ERCC4-type nuclease
MSTCMKREWRILQDHREKKPLLFPEHLVMLDPAHLPHRGRTITVRLRVDRRDLKTGDYLLASAETRTIIERKGHLVEVATNCLTVAGRRRFVKCCQRLRDSCEHPVLLLEGTPLELRTQARDLDHPEIAIDALQRLCREYRMELLMLPTSSTIHRRLMGEWAARLLINGAISHAPPDIPVHEPTGAAGHG